MAGAEANSEPDPKWIGLFFYVGRWSGTAGSYFLPAMVQQCWGRALNAVDESWSRRAQKGFLQRFLQKAFVRDARNRGSLTRAPVCALKNVTAGLNFFVNGL